MTIDRSGTDASVAMAISCRRRRHKRAHEWATGMAGAGAPGANDQASEADGDGASCGTRNTRFCAG